MNELKAWWAQTSVRERRLVIIGASLLVLGCFYWLILQPLNQNVAQMQQRLASEKSLNQWIQKQANIITTLKKQGGISRTRTNQPLNQVVATTADANGIQIIRMNPKENQIQVWVQPAGFNQLLSWLNELRQEQGMDVLFLDIKLSDEIKGAVEVDRLQLERG